MRRLKADEERVWQREKTKQETERLSAEKSAAEAEIQALQEMLTAQEKAQQEWQVMLFMQEKLLLEKKAQEQTIARKREFIEGIEALLQQKADIAKKERDLQGMQKKYLAAEGAWQAAEGRGNAGGNALSARTGRLSGGEPYGGDGLPCLRRNAPSP